MLCCMVAGIGGNDDRDAGVLGGNGNGLGHSGAAVRAPAVARSWALPLVEPERVEANAIAATGTPHRPHGSESALSDLPRLPPPADIAAAIRAYAWPYAWATSTIFCESTFDPGAEGKAGERGLTQIAFVHIDRIHRLGFTWAQMYEVGPNLAVAYDLWSEQGERPWEGSGDCWHNTEGRED